MLRPDACVRCYRGRTDGIPSSSEIGLLVPPSGVSSRRSRTRKGVEQHMQDSFHALGVSAQVAQALAALDIHSPFPIQTLVLPDALSGLDVLAKAPTGSGKTLAFSVPIVERTSADTPSPAALVLVPT